MKPLTLIPLTVFTLALAACLPIPSGAQTEAPLATPAVPPDRPVLIWEREGGFAGFCDRVIVYASAPAQVFNCKGETKTTFSLTETQRAQLDVWLATYQPIDYTQSDPAVADAMTITLFLAGGGSQQADAAVIQKIMEFASDLAAQAQANLNPPLEKAEAEKALRDFLNALNAGDYILGAKLYGGDTELLQTWNPDITDDLPALLERACAQNGLVCMSPRTVIYRGLDADGNYRFLVEFTDPDGALFAQGPCCGETEGPTFSSFLFRVKQTESGFAALDLPPYVP